MKPTTHLPEPGSLPLFSPALWRLYAVTQWRRAFGLNLSRLDDLLFIGGEFACEQWPALHAMGVRAVLSLQGEREDVFCEPLPVQTLRLEVDDFHAPSIEQLTQAVNFLRVVGAAGHPTLIHCHAGVGRAPLTTAALLIANGASAHAAVRRIHRARPIIRLNRRQWARLREWERFVAESGLKG